MPLDWTPQGDYDDIRYETAEGIAKITIDRPEVRNAFRPHTVDELYRTLEHARQSSDIGAVLLTTITSSLTALNVDKFWQQAIVGVLILTAILVERIASIRKARRLRTSEATNA